MTTPPDNKAQAEALFAQATEALKTGEADVAEVDVRAGGLQPPPEGSLFSSVEALLSVITYLVHAAGGSVMITQAGIDAMGPLSLAEVHGPEGVALLTRVPGAPLGSTPH